MRRSLAALGWLLLSLVVAHAQAPVDKVETVIVIRHGEKPGNKPHDDKGQLSPVGLRRALLLPDVLLAKFGRPDFIIAPLPTQDIAFFKHPYFYVRPLMTIEPTAVQLGLPVDTKYAYNEVEKLAGELTSEPYQSATVFVAWEHVMMVKFVRLMLTSLGGSAAELVDWPGNDYDSIFILRINTDAQGKRRITLSKDHEGLNAVVNPPSS